jgi:signal peptidase I
MPPFNPPCLTHMQSTMPPSISPLPRAKMSRRAKLLLTCALVPAICTGTLGALRICGLVRPFSVPTGAMTPAMVPGDHIMMEGVTYLAREPRRGDIVVFKTEGIYSVPQSTIYTKRVVGEPGDHVRIAEGKLFINETFVSLSNTAGPITYDSPPQVPVYLMQTNVNVPSDCYFVLGDNSTNSRDSRFWGTVPRDNIIGRVSFCYWPLERVGGVK